MSALEKIAATADAVAARSRADFLAGIKRRQEQANAAPIQQQQFDTSHLQNIDVAAFVAIRHTLIKLAMSLKTWACQNNAGTVIVRDDDDRVIVRFYKTGKLDIEKNEKEGGKPLKAKTERLLHELQQLAHDLKHAPRQYVSFPPQPESRSASTRSNQETRFTQ